MKTMLKLGVHKSVNVKEIMMDVITKKNVSVANKIVYANRYVTYP